MGEFCVECFAECEPGACLRTNDDNDNPISASPPSPTVTVTSTVPADDKPAAQGVQDSSGSKRSEGRSDRGDAKGSRWDTPATEDRSRKRSRSVRSRSSSPTRLFRLGSKDPCYVCGRHVDSKTCRSV